MPNVVRLRFFPAKPLSEIDRFERLLCRTEEVDGLDQAVHLACQLISVSIGALVYEHRYDAIAMLVPPSPDGRSGTIVTFDSAGLRDDSEVIGELLVDVRTERGVDAVCTLCIQIIHMAIVYLAQTIDRSFARNFLETITSTVRPAA